MKLCGENEKYVFISQSLKLNKKLTKNKKPFQIQLKRLLKIF